MELSVRVLVADSQTLRANDTRSTRNVKTVTVRETRRIDGRTREKSGRRKRWSIREKDERRRSKIAIPGKLNAANG